MKKSVYENRRWRTETKFRKKRWPFLLVSIIALVLVVIIGAVIAGYNPLLERQLRSQFGDDFFTDLAVDDPAANGEDLESIIAIYEPAFKEIEAKALQRLDNLLEAALEEYYQEKNEGTLNRFMLTNKYIQAGRMLENNVDKTFNALLDKMKAELTRKGHSTAITTEIKDTYHNSKDEKRRELLDRLQKTINE